MGPPVAAAVINIAQSKTFGEACQGKISLCIVLAAWSLHCATNSNTPSAIDGVLIINPYADLNSATNSNTPRPCPAEWSHGGARHPPRQKLGCGLELGYAPAKLRPLADWCLRARSRIWFWSPVISKMVAAKADPAEQPTCFAYDQVGRRKEPACPLHPSRRSR